MAGKSSFKFWNHENVNKPAFNLQFVAFIVDVSGNDSYSGILVDTLENPGQILEQLPSVNIGELS